MKVRLTEDVELRGGDEVWNPRRFEMLKAQNPDGRVAVTDDKKQTFIAPIGKLEIVKDER